MNGKCAQFSALWSELKATTSALKNNSLIESLSETKKNIASLTHEYATVWEKIFVSIDRAYEIFNDQNMLGPKEINEIWDKTINPEDIPRIPFSEDELICARDAGMYLILRVNTFEDGTPMTFKSMVERVGSKIPIGEGQFFNEADINTFLD